MPRHRDRERLRRTFGSVAEQYDRARPGYPPEIFDDLAELAGLREGSRVVEVGPGTGKATVELIRRGYAVTGVELSADLAEVARRNAPAAEIVVAEFEKWEPEPAGFDAIVALAAYHWIDPEHRYAKPLALLRAGGALAVVHGRQVLPAGGDPVRTELQEDYDAVVPHPDNAAPPAPEEIADEWGTEFRASGVFEHVEERQHIQELVYTADEYVDVLGTFSENIALPAAQRDELFDRIHARIAARPGGVATKHFLLTLTVGRLPA